MVLSGPSKSSTIAASGDATLISMVNPEDNSVSTFSASTKTLLSRAMMGADTEPSAVVYNPDGRSAWVANRASATVVKLTGLDTATPTVGTPINVGSEPTGLALSPTGRFLVVAEWAEGQVSVIDTTTGTKVGSRTMRNPRAVAVTNDGDGEDSDERVIATEFYGRPVGTEATDTSRTGAVKVFTLSAAGALADDGEVTFGAGDGGFGVQFSPNQLFGVAISGTRAYIPAIGASPAGPPKFDNNVAPVVLVADLTSKTEVTGGSGSQSLAPLVNAFPAPRQFLADLVDLAFVPGDIAYAVARGGEVVQRLVYNPTANTLTLGSSQNNQIELTAATPPVAGAQCFNPTGIVAFGGPTFRAYVNCWGSQRLGIIDLASQTLTDAVVSVPPPGMGTAADSVRRGRHFFFTGRGRWSNSGWSSCGSCHPDGLSDNVTWIFAAGPRQSTSMDGTFSHGAGMQKQRIFNWTGIIDEMHDFEANTRGVQGGRGAITTAPTAGECGNLTAELQVGSNGQPDAGLPAGLGTSMKAVVDGLAINCAPGNWDDINNYAKTIRPPRGRRPTPAGTLDPAAVTRGATQFTSGGCDKCHGGPGWTVSRRHYTPETAGVVATVTATPFMKPAAWPVSWTFHSTVQIAAQPATAEPVLAMAIAPPQLACSIRNVGTFGGDALELKPGAGGRAQGRGGYNVPSLYGLQVATPLLHHGGATSLDDLFTNATWLNHTQAGNALYLTGGTAAADRADLIQYLWSLDATTAEVAVPAGFDTGCAP